MLTALEVGRLEFFSRNKQKNQESKFHRSGPLRFKWIAVGKGRIVVAGPETFMVDVDKMRHDAEVAVFPQGNICSEQFLPTSGSPPYATTARFIRHLCSSLLPSAQGACMCPSANLF